ncbi:hypothetical protein MKW98_003887 [Papaver atlanticum]|uniref:Uncharacterized protein n=1 Tax=Papaver atlanticum TaxID=357466 RepID=A0AAD4SMJ5_9MAGN|nr:hypothetical protein MKW98_003887 [Papaver atlanticum]
MKVQVISKEIIKPSVATPHLRNFKISLLDQLLPPFYVPIVIYYPASTADNESDNHDTREQSSKSELLKKSLSEILTHFYPMAGKVKDNILIDCNNEGVEFIEAKVDGVMSDFMSAEAVHQLHPIHIMLDDVVKDAQLAIQVNSFDCGGIAISISTSHKIIDGCTAVTFIRSWAATTRGAPKHEILYPTFDSADIFPALPPEVQVSSLESDDSIQGENVVTKVFLFTAPKIAALRARIVEFRSSNVLSKYPTRTEVLSALIWRSFIKTSRVKASCKLTHSDASTKPIIIRSLTNYAVNLRTRLNPPLPQVSFGNIIMDATAESTTTIDHEEATPGFIETLDELIGQLRLGVSKIDGEYIRKLQEGDVEFLKSLDEASHHSNGQDGDENDEKVLICWLNSLCRFPFYETDFGWGKPSWIALNTNAEYKNSLFLIDTKCGTGVEAWVSLEEEDMAIFEKDQDLLEYAKTIN